MLIWFDTFWYSLIHVNAICIHCQENNYFFQPFLKTYFHNAFEWEGSTNGKTSCMVVNVKMYQILSHIADIVKQIPNNCQTVIHIEGTHATNVIFHETKI